MYTARNGFTITDDVTRDGKKLRTVDDLLGALQGREEFRSLPENTILDALYQATTKRKNYRDFDDLARYIAYYFVR